MKKVQLIIIFTAISALGQAQRVHVGLFGGTAAYLGDITDKIFPEKVTNGALGFSVNYEIADYLTIRGSVIYAVVGGADVYSKKAGLVIRNLSFETSILEFGLTGEYNLLSLYDNRYSPYVFAGMAMFTFNPYAYDVSGKKVFLKPLSTEGQGINGYPDRKPYHLHQLAIPFGGGIKFAINDDLRIGVEVGIRKLFTDYLDDVSTNYIDQADLLAAKGQLAVDMAYRGDEAGGSPVYPAKDYQRGSPESKDYYYFTGLHLTYRMGKEGGSGGGGSSRKGKTGCPVNVY
jgi:hypothetical protein